MDRLVRARLLLAEAEALGITIDDLVVAAGTPETSRQPASAPTLAEYVDTVAPSFSDNTAADLPVVLAPRRVPVRRPAGRHARRG